MTLKQILLGSAGVAIFTAVGVPCIPISLVPPAMAAAEVSISIDTFYDRLADQGDWVSYHRAIVFVPTRVSNDWHPYTVGHWIHTKRYGWIWVSEEPFGWATYHYGRWGYADDIGWYWVPGRRWAPAWVSWRHEGEHIIWAPLPPRHDDDDVVSIDLTYDDTPDYYWVAVPTREFLAPNLSIVVIRDDQERRRIVNLAGPLGEVKYQNNVVINNFVDVNVIERETKRQIMTVDVKDTDRPEETGKLQNNEITIFNGNVKPDANAKPKRIKDIEEVKQVQTNRKLKPADGAESTHTTPPTQTPIGEKPTGEAERTGEQQKPLSKQPSADERKPHQTEKGGETSTPVAKEPARDESKPRQSDDGGKQKKSVDEKPVTNESKQGQSEQGGEQPNPKDKKPVTNEPKQGQSEQGGEQPKTKDKKPVTIEPKQGQSDQGGEQPRPKDKKPVTIEPKQGQSDQGGEQPKPKDKDRKSVV